MAGVVRVELPEHGVLDLPLAGLGRRSFGAIVDGLIVAGLGLLILLVFALAGVPGDAFPALLAVASALPVLVPLVMELAGEGRTPGKRLCETRVISSDGTNATRGQLVLRNIIRLVDFLPVSYALGLLVIAASARGQRLGDLVAGTLVIREDAGALAELTKVRAPNHRSGLDASLLRGVRLLREREPKLNEDIFRARRSELLKRARQLRGDWKHHDDDELWRLLDVEIP